MARFAGKVHGVVVQMTSDAPSAPGGGVTSANFTNTAGEVFSLYSTSASASAVCAP
jgi:hypothetical protein